MTIEQRLEKMKRTYHATRVHEQEAVDSGWQDLEPLLGQQQRFYPGMYYRAFAMLGVVIVFAGGLFTVAQAAKPGEALYGVKQFSQKAAAQLTGATYTPEVLEKQPTPTRAVTVMPTKTKPSSTVSQSPTQKPTENVKGIETKNPVENSIKNIENRSSNVPTGNPSVQNKVENIEKHAATETPKEEKKAETGKPESPGNSENAPGKKNGKE